MKKILSLFMSFVMLFSLTVSIDFSAYSAEDDYLFTPLSEKNKTCQIIAYKGSEAHLTVPSILHGYKVTSIGDWAFSQKTKLKSVIIPNKVTSIGDSAFYCCTELKSILLPNSLKSIGEHAFYRCRNLSSIEIPDSVREIKDSSFYGCRSLTLLKSPIRQR